MLTISVTIEIFCHGLAAVQMGEGIVGVCEGLEIYEEGTVEGGGEAKDKVMCNGNNQ